MGKADETNYYPPSVEATVKSNLEHIESSYRQEEMATALYGVGIAMNTLGVQEWSIPHIVVNFIPTPEGKKPILGRVSEDLDGNIKIEYAEEFKTEEGEKELTAQIDPHYPGFVNTFTHELGHATSESITGLHNQPLYRLLEEGWASVIESLSTGRSIEEAAEDVKKVIKLRHSKSDPNFLAVLKIADLPLNLRALNAAEYAVGKAFVFWYLQSRGLETTKELLRKSPTKEKRIREIDGKPQLADVRSELHSTSVKYLEIRKKIEEEGVTTDTNRVLSEWERNQFYTALLETSGLDSLEDIENGFINWVGIK